MSVQTYKDIITKKNTMELADWVIENYTLEIPESIENADDMALVSKLLANTVNKISFISNLLSYTKVLQRESKRKTGSVSKLENEDLIDKKEVLSNTLESLILQHKALSRMITVRQEILNELKMNEVY